MSSKDIMATVAVAMLKFDGDHANRREFGKQVLGDIFEFNDELMEEVLDKVEETITEFLEQLDAE